MKSKLEPVKITIITTVEFDTEIQEYEANVKCLIKHQETKDGYRVFPYILLSPDTRVLDGYLNKRHKRYYGDCYEFSQESYFEDYDEAVEFCEKKAIEVKQTLEKVIEANKEKCSFAHYDREDFVIG